MGAMIGFQALGWLPIFECGWFLNLRSFHCPIFIALFCFDSLSLVKEGIVWFQVLNHLHFDLEILDHFLFF
jgi:hypothetical protein